MELHHFAYQLRRRWTHLRCEGWQGFAPRVLRVRKFDGPLARGLWIALRAMLIKSALRIWLFVSYGMIGILVIGSLRSPPKGKLRNGTWNIWLPVFPLHTSRFPLRGTPRRGKGCTRHSTDRMLHRYPDRQSAAPWAKRYNLSTQPLAPRVV